MADAVARFAAHVESSLGPRCACSDQDVVAALRDAFSPASAFGDPMFSEGCRLADILEGTCDVDADVDAAPNILPDADIKRQFPGLARCVDEDPRLARLFTMVARASGYASFRTTSDALRKVESRDWNVRGVAIAIVSCVALIVFGLCIVALAGFISTVDRHAAMNSQLREKANSA